MTFNSSSPLTPLPGETFFCHLVDAAGELPPVVVLAVEEVLGTVFSCSLQGRLPNYQGFSTGVVWYVFEVVIIAYCVFLYCRDHSKLCKFPIELDI